jgi:hypothetical protein
MGENVPSPLHVFLRRIGGDGGQPSFRPELECLTWNLWTSVSRVPVARLRALATRNRCHSLDLLVKIRNLLLFPGQPCGRAGSRLLRVASIVCPRQQHR